MAVVNCFGDKFGGLGGAGVRGTGIRLARYLPFYLRSRVITDVNFTFEVKPANDCLRRGISWFSVNNSYNNNCNVVVVRLELFPTHAVEFGYEFEVVTVKLTWWKSSGILSQIFSNWTWEIWKGLHKINVVCFLFQKGSNTNYNKLDSDMLWTTKHFDIPLKVPETLLWSLPF